MTQLDDLYREILRLMEEIGKPRLLPIISEDEMSYKVGDKLRYYGHDVTVSKSMPYSVHGEKQYEVETATGTKYIAAESELMYPSLPTGLDAWMSEAPTPMLNTRPPPIESKGNGCECGAWATTYQDDHMTFCPKFKGS